MKTPPLISIIVPVYNVEQYIDECVMSLTKQTYKTIEVILVDDGSKDDCPTICDKWSSIDSRIRVIHKNNGGLSSARNVGVAHASGQYIGFVDSDDFVEIEMYEKLLQPFLSDGAVMMTACMISKYIDGNKSIYDANWIVKKRKEYSLKDFVLGALAGNHANTAWNKLYSREILSNVYFQEGKTNEDTLYMYDIWKNVNRLGVVVEIPDFLYNYRIRPNSITTSESNPLMLSVLSNLEYIISDNKEKKLTDVMTKKYINTVFVYLIQSRYRDDKSDAYLRYKNILSSYPKTMLFRACGFKRALLALKILYTKC